MRKNKKRNRVFLLLILLLAISIGFALLSTTLKINGTAGIGKNVWDVHWDNVNDVVKSEGAVLAQNGGAAVDATDNTLVSFNVTLNQPGDFYEFQVDAVNAGTLDAMVEVVPTATISGDDTTLPDYLTFTVKYADGGDIQRYHLLPKAEDLESTPPVYTRERYKVRLEFSKDVDPEDLDEIINKNSYTINLTTPYIQADEHAIPAHPTWNLPEGKNSNTLAVGDEICLAADSTQCFNFIRYDENNDIVMLAKWNLKVGNIYSSGQKTGEYTSSDPGYGLQSSEARGYVQNETKYGTVPFSTDTYWVESFNLKPVYGSSYPADIYDEVNYKGNPDAQNYSVAYYVDKYKTLLTNKGATIKKARLLTYSEATDSSIGCSGSSYNCPTSGFIMNTSFWLGSSYNSYCLWTVYLNNYFSNYRWDISDNIGVRPVVVVEKSNL